MSAYIRIAILILVITTFSLPSFAQSQEGQTAPEIRGTIQLSDSDWWNPSDSRMVRHPEEISKHWYEEECCSNADCRGFSQSLVTENRDGSVTLHLPPYGNFSGLDIPFLSSQIKGRPNNARSDAMWHFCFTLNMDVHTAALYPVTHCAYPPSPGV